MSEKDAISSSSRPITRSGLADDFRELGVNAGSTIIVHSSLSSLGWVCGGAVAVIEALIDTVTEEGTIVMPAHSSDYTDPAFWGNPPVPESWWETIRSEMPAYQPEITPTRSMGIIAESFRKFPGVVRSKHPNFSFTAWGKNALEITSQHHFDYPLGDKSPLAAIYRLKGQVLLLGVDYDSNTSLHLAEYRADFLKKRIVQGAPVLENGQRQWISYQDFELDTEQFIQLGRDFEKKCFFSRGTVGQARARLMDQRELVDFAVNWLERNMESSYQIEEITAANRADVSGLIKERWGSSKIVSRKKVYEVDQLPGYLAVKDKQIVGLVTYHFSGAEIEVISLDSFLPGFGIGSTLLQKIKELAQQKNMERVFLITSNDNIEAIKFYQKRGFSLSAVYRGAINQAREIKPQIPQIGNHGITIEDEIEFEYKIKDR